MRAVKIGAVILAAGFSRRLGRPKQDVVLAGETLLTRAVRIARATALEPVIVVVREARYVVELQPLAATVLFNEDAEQGMATSVVKGVSWAQQLALEGLVLMTCDQPALRSQHLRALCADPQHITASRYAGRAGVPAYFPATAFAELLQLRGDAGARSLLQHAPAVVNEALALDIDTAEDLRAAEQQLLPSAS